MAVEATQELIWELRDKLVEPGFRLHRSIVQGDGEAALANDGLTAGGSGEAPIPYVQPGKLAAAKKAATKEVEDLVTVAVEIVNKHASTAPESVALEAVRRVVSYLFDQPNAAAGMRYGRAFKSSGAAALLAPWRERRAGRVAGAEVSE